jgi:SPP1 gp7 family putative phage head morphogenesis protein
MADKRRGDAWKRPITIERRYRFEIDKLLDEYFRLPTAGGLGEITARLVEWSQVDRLFQAHAERAASSMVTGVAAHNAKNWRAAAQKATRGQKIFGLLNRELAGPVGAVIRERVRENAALIKSLPQRTARDVNAFIAKEQLAGRRSGDIARHLRSHLPDLTRSQVLRLARTETAKAETAVTRARAEHLSLDWYEWDTSEDARVRKSHRHMDRVLVRFSDPPAPEALIGIRSSLGHYHAGEAPYCRCGAYPLVAAEEVRWPHKVYMAGRITVMTRGQFLDVAPGYRIAA